MTCTTKRLENFNELRTADLLLRGKTAKEIGRILGLSHRTIEHRIERMKLKLEADNKSHLIEILLSHKPFLLIGESNRLRKD